MFIGRPNRIRGGVRETEARSSGGRRSDRSHLRATRVLIDSLCEAITRALRPIPEYRDVRRTRSAMNIVVDPFEFQDAGK